ncbi:hypothetical protein DQ04_09621000 [Trypanosoma grayi]|uniref:hypothetical protein n=1 Tax=Trypanosoma grayi TaxID=71804 RepID=UPI0004F42C89|nr:hypothetical protein DQ04_09621000 [Trypanosoma grayi]KEG07497.1 hypothetical protein DQ04_09621000 [Trypanosoma grayi]
MSATRRGTRTECSPRYSRLYPRATDAGAVPFSCSSLASREASAATTTGELEARVGSERRDPVRQRVLKPASLSARALPARSGVPNGVGLASADSAALCRGCCRAAHADAGTSRTTWTTSRSTTSTARKSTRKKSKTTSQHQQHEEDSIGANMYHAARAQPMRVSEVPHVRHHHQQQQQQQHLDYASLEAEELNSLPRLLLSQDLRGEQARQERLQAAPSPRTGVPIRSAIRQSHSQSVQSTQESRGEVHLDSNADDDEEEDAGSLLHDMHTAVGTTVSEFGAHPHYHQEHHHDPFSDISRSPSVRRTAGPVVTEEWARSIVQPQDEYLLYDRRAPGSTNYEEMVRRNQALWLRERARRVGRHSADHSGVAAVAAAVPAAMPVLTARWLQNDTQDLPSTSPDAESTPEMGESDAAARARTVQMNERHIIARGTPLLFRQPRARLFASDRHSGGYWKQGSTMTSTSTTAEVSTGVELSPVLLQRRSDNDIMISSILQNGFNRVERSASPVDTGSCNNNNNINSNVTPASASLLTLTNKRPVLLSQSFTPLPALRSSSRPSTPFDEGKEQSPGATYGESEQRGGSSGAVSLPSPLLLDIAAQEAAELFANPLFALRSDENYERLMLAQAEHDERELLLQQHVTSLQLGHSVLCANSTNGGQKPRLKVEVSVSVQQQPKQAPRKVRSEPATPPPPHGLDNSRNTSTEATGARRTATTTASVAKEREERSGSGTGRYVVLGTSLRSRAPALVKGSEVPQRLSAKSEERPVQWAVRGADGGLGVKEIHGGRQVTAAAPEASPTAHKRGSKNKSQSVATAARPTAAAAADTAPPSRHFGGVSRPLKVSELRAASAGVEQRRQERAQRKKEQPQRQQQQLQEDDDEEEERIPPSYHTDSTPDVSPTKYSIASESPTPSLKGAENGRARDATGQWDIPYPTAESLARGSSAPRSPVRHKMMEDVVSRNAESPELLNTTSGISCVKPLSGSAVVPASRSEATQPSPKSRGGRRGSSPSSSKLSELECVSRGEEQDVELNEYALFVLQQRRGKRGIAATADDNGILWLKQQLRLVNGKECEATESDRSDSLWPDKSISGTVATGEDALGNDENDSDLLMEDGGHYARNVACVLTAFGQLWQTPFQDVMRREELSLAVQAQLLLFEGSPLPDERDVVSSVDNTSTQNNVISSNCHSAQIMCTGPEE